MDRLQEARQLFFEPSPEERGFRNVVLAVAATALWFALALAEPLLLLELPLLAFLYVKLVAVRRREGACRGEEPDDWSFY